MTDQDRDLVRTIREALAAIDGVPPEAVAAAKAVFVARDLDAELAKLIMDSARDEPVLAMRGLARRSLSFETDRRSVELEIDPERRLIRGQLAPPVSTSLTLEVDDLPVDTVVSDDLGRFLLSGVPEESTTVALRVRLDDGDVICRFDL